VTDIENTLPVSGFGENVITDTDALLATVREALYGYEGSGPMPDAYAALDSLAAELERVKAERDEWRNEAESRMEMEQNAPEAEARLDKALGLARTLKMGQFATAHPDGAFGLPPNTWEVPAFVQTMAAHLLAEIEGGA